MTKDFMTASLRRANAEAGDFMSDSRTWIVEKGVAADFQTLYRGGEFQVNTCPARAGAAAATAGRDIAERLIAFVVSSRGRGGIADYGQDRFGEGFYNDATYAGLHE